MKAFKVILLLSILVLSCKNDTKTTVENKTPEAEVVKKETPRETIKKQEGTFLCNINGEAWNYTKASGIVSRHKKTQKRTAIITFTKQLEKGKESVQLFYDGDTDLLEEATAILKTPKKGGGTMSAMYQLKVKGGKRVPESKISGTLDLSNLNASGTAEVSHMKIRFEEDKLADEAMGTLSFTPISFSGVGYSDAEKLFQTK
ncbi:hypothetical protein FPF71_13985 [Algibacter amylolyticus]|uniref:Lipoprotein n=1 Tax=Algibacter amylolyticus TaxID=1608400 RepID=A0A5M7B2K3_9FLAO|nr:hypothetical protein [Algibacter amylolyticus]KAA5823796.1 hypothetical protein F2B50_13985 [Algibacter amylolyticus]MBB5267970.1 hypothetical protein [Algibacter amylolyticus]TSJ74284.1 hypothetical protein FPF71_13985 [Algibacter amylolyticus]